VLKAGLVTQPLYGICKEMHWIQIEILSTILTTHTWYCNLKKVDIKQRTHGGASTKATRNWRLAKRKELRIWRVTCEACVDKEQCVWDQRTKVMFITL